MTSATTATLPFGEAPWHRLSEQLADRLGLHFPQERHEDLKRGLRAVARECGFDDVLACIHWLFAQPLAGDRLQLLARHLTVGETYFFRDAASLGALKNHVLPMLIAQRRGERRLRVWSAACCSGEEAYTLAILLQQGLPDIDSWDIQLLATDINAAAVAKGIDACYGEWSFRCAPAWLKPCYFEHLPDGRYRVVQEIRQRVTFGVLNLVDLPADPPRLVPGEMDLIVCRNVLMYFTPAQIARVAGALRHCLRPDGWLGLGPAEGLLALGHGFMPVSLEGATFLCRAPAQAPGEAQPPAPPSPALESLQPSSPPSSIAAPGASAVRPDSPRPASMRPDAAAPSEAASPAAEASASAETSPTSAAEQARLCADQGRLSEALVWCDRWLANDKLDAAGHYTRAVVLIEQGDLHSAHLALQRAVYLDEAFVLAHFALGSLAAQRGQDDNARRHFVNARRALQRYGSNDQLPESQGVRAGQLDLALAQALSM